MKKNLKLLSGILMASFISAPVVDSVESVKARASRQVVVNASSNQVNASSSTEKSTSSRTSDENSNSSSKEQNISAQSSNDENLKTEGEESTTSENEILNEENLENGESTGETSEEGTTDSESEEGTTSIFEMLNSDKNITVDEIKDLSMPLSHSQDFIDEFTTTFPNLNPLRKLTSTSNNMDLYLDVNSNETKSVTQYLNNSKSYPSVYADQNKCNMLISEIDRLISEINDDISTELPSTIFSLMPTITVFSDTFKILSLEYNSVLETNSENQIVLKILLKDVEDKLVSLLASINEFKTQLPDLIEELDSLAKSSSSSNSNSNKNDNETIEEEILDEEIVEEEVLDEEIKDEEIVEEETQEEIVEEEIVEEVVEENSNNNTKEEVVEEEIEEEIDPNSIILYFGDQGQEVVYDESTKKYYQLDPENPDSENLIEYSGEVSEMTLAEYLNIDVFLDKDGNELLYDADTDSYFSYDEQKDEFVVYEGEVTKLKMKDILETSE